MGTAMDVKRLEKKKMVSQLSRELQQNVKQMKEDSKFSDSLMLDISDAFSSSSKTTSELGLQ